MAMVKMMIFPREWNYNENQAKVNIWQWMIIKQTGQLIQSEFKYFNTEIAQSQLEPPFSPREIEFNSEEIVLVNARKLLIYCFAYLYWERVMEIARQNCRGMNYILILSLLYKNSFI